MKFTVAIGLLASYAGLTSATVGCQVELLNTNQASVGSACVPFEGVGLIVNSVTGTNFFITATRDCGVSVQQGPGRQVLPDGFSLRRVGFC